MICVMRRSKKEAAHDVLAAEEFGVPAPDPTLHHGPVTLPGDPTGIVEPHDGDVFVAEPGARIAVVARGATRRSRPAR